MPRPKENNTALFVALGAAALLLVGAIVVMKVLLKPPPPPVATVAAAPEVQPLRAPLMYRGVLDEDARRFGVPPVALEELGRPLARTVELEIPRVLKPGESFDTEHLHVQAEVTKEWAKNESGQGFRYEHLVLTIANKGAAPVAYRVETRVAQPEKCASMAPIPHNAIALQPGEKAVRSECIFHPGMTLTVMAAETLELPPIGYFYVSRLLPQQVGLDKRTAAGHAPPRTTKVCSYIPWREIELAGAAWDDVMDFYARHNCDDYSFYPSYKRRVEAGPLPAVDPKSGAGGAMPRDGGATTP